MTDSVSDSPQPGLQASPDSLVATVENLHLDQDTEQKQSDVVNGGTVPSEAKNEGFGDDSDREMGEKIDDAVNGGIEALKDKDECGDGIDGIGGKNDVVVNGVIDAHKEQVEWGAEVGENVEDGFIGVIEAYKVKDEWGDESGKKDVAINGGVEDYKGKDEWGDDIVKVDVAANGGSEVYRDEWGDEIGERDEGKKGGWEAGNVDWEAGEKVGVEYGERVSLSAGDETVVYPLRPGKIDCAFYMKTGRCAYGANCRFNHPNRIQTPDQMKWGDQAEVVEIAKEKGAEDFSVKGGHIECKYYLTPGGCKYGKSCKYEHVQEKLDAQPVNLNFLGLPIRPGVKDCVYYMRNGACKYSANCCFNHPDPTAMAGQNPFPGQLDGSSLQQTSPMIALSPPTSEKQYTSTVSTYLTSSAEVMPNPTVSMPNNSLPSYIPRMLFPPKADNLNSGFKEYQAPATIHFPPVKKTERPQYTASDRSMPIADCTVQMDFPERPGQPECPFFMKTGNCKFRLQCKFHHPRSRLSKQSISPYGLPLRPDQPICSSYRRFGICKYGPDCKFDHSEDSDSSTTGSARSYREIVNARAI